ncbi:MAG: NAD(P)H-dependent oxidoreductase subunit E [Proteobacteria bacterium]|nr:NAD(P)H-dependent oxidoreductase subunit E [Pseudomonadota bacterium]MBU1742043.1 NAD(P)H-dependent oxidoreductase subunit E [Pseudomonadota bacterium]
MNDTDAQQDLTTQAPAGAPAAGPPEEPPVDMEYVDQVIDRYGGQAHFALQMLLDINNEFNYLPQQALRHLARRVDMAPSNLYSIATFFKAFSLVPRGRHIISICLGTACHVKGQPQNYKRLQSDLAIEDGETTEDMRFSLQSVRCLGACALAPVMVIDDDTHSRLAPDQMLDILDTYE